MEGSKRELGLLFNIQFYQVKYSNQSRVNVLFQQVIPSGLDTVNVLFQQIWSVLDSTKWKFGTVLFSQTTEWYPVWKRIFNV